MDIDFFTPLDIHWCREEVEGDAHCHIHYRLSGSGEVKYGSKIMYSNPISNSFTLTFGDEFGCDDLVCFSGKYRIGHLSISQLNREPRFYFSWAEMVEDTQYNYKLNGTGSWTYDRRSRIFTFISTGEYWMDRFKIVDGVGVWDHGVWYANPVFVLLGEPIS